MTFSFLVTFVTEENVAKKVRFRQARETVELGAGLKRKPNFTTVNSRKISQSPRVARNAASAA